MTQWHLYLYVFYQNFSSLRTVCVHVSNATGSNAELQECTDRCCLLTVCYFLSFLKLHFNHHETFSDAFCQFTFIYASLTSAAQRLNIFPPIEELLFHDIISRISFSPFISSCLDIITPSLNDTMAIRLKGNFTKSHFESSIMHLSCPSMNGFLCHSYHQVGMF